MVDRPIWPQIMAGIAVMNPPQTNERIPRIKLQTALGALCAVGSEGPGTGGGVGGVGSSAMPPFYRMNGQKQERVGTRHPEKQSTDYAD
jgi:hypothetical protein